MGRHIGTAILCNWRRGGAQGVPFLKVLNLDVPTAKPARGRRSIAFGAERLALVPFKAPAATVLAALALALLAILGIQRIRVDNSLSQLFRSNDPAFDQFEQVSRDFPSSEYDVLIVVSGQSLLAREFGRKAARLSSPTFNSSMGRAALSRCFRRASPLRKAGCRSPSFPTPCRKAPATMRLSTG